MRISQTGQILNSKSVARTQKKATGRGFQVRHTSGSGDEGAARSAGLATAQISDVSALLAFQEDEQGQGGGSPYQQQAHAYGASLLDELDALKRSETLSGLDDGALLRLKQRLAQHKRGAFGAGGVQDVIDEIETRALVELAKRGIETDSLL